MSRLKPFKLATGDVNYLDYGATWYRKLSGKRIGEKRRYHFLRLINWEDACGKDAPKEKYNVVLAEVNLDQISGQQIADALRSWGKESETTDVWIALACFESGLQAPLWDSNGNNFKAMYKIAASESTRVETDAQYRYQQMNRPVNKIGSTATEFMRGDIFSGLERSYKAGDPAAKLIVTMYEACSKAKE